MPTYAQKDGEVLTNVFTTGEELPADALTSFDYFLVDDGVTAATHYYNTVAEEVQERPDLSTVVTWDYSHWDYPYLDPNGFKADGDDYATVDDVPVGAVVSIESTNPLDPGRRVMSTTVNDGFCEFATTYRDEYIVRISAFPYRDYSHVIVGEP